MSVVAQIVVKLSPSQVVEMNRVSVLVALLPAMIHDSRNALQSISGTTELLAMALPRTDRIEERGRAIVRACGGLGRRLEEYLTLLRPQPALPMAVDLHRMCTHAIELRQASWGRMGVAAVRRIDPGIFAFASPPDVLRVVLNLILNAEQMLAASGGGEITLGVEAAGSAVRLHVDDSGPGVVDEVRPRLFDVFVKPDSGLATGLYVARRLAAQAGGDVTWNPVSGRTRFTATWPAAASAVSRR